MNSIFHRGCTAGVLAIVLLSLALAGSGCVDIRGEDGGSDTMPPSSPTDTETEEPISSTPTTTKEQTSLVKENEFVRSGTAFNNEISERLEIHRTKFVESRAFRNNTVELTVELYNNTDEYADGSLRASAMDVTQAVATLVHGRTTSNESLAFENGSDGLLHQPKNVFVRIQGIDGRSVGRFEVNPSLARAYMDHRFGTDAFADHVVGTFHLDRKVPRGNHSPEWYLNLSQLRNWGLIYIDEVQRSSNPDESGYHKAIPTSGVSPHPGDFRIHHEIKDWKVGEMGQYATSAEATIYGAYWRTTQKSSAMPPERVSVYVHVIEKNDLKSYMKRKHVYDLLSAPKINQTTLTNYQLSRQTKFVEDDE